MLDKNYKRPLFQSKSSQNLKWSQPFQHSMSTDLIRVLIWAREQEINQNSEGSQHSLAWMKWELILSSLQKLITPQFLFLFSLPHSCFTGKVTPKWLICFLLCFCFLSAFLCLWGWVLLLSPSEHSCFMKWSVAGCWDCKLWPVQTLKPSHCSVSQFDFHCVVNLWVCHPKIQCKT